MFGYNKTETLLLVSLLLFAGLLFAVWSHGNSLERYASDHVAAKIENLKDDLDPEHLTFDDLNRLLGVPGQYTPGESPAGASKFTWGRVVEATFPGSVDTVKASSTPVSLGIGDDKFTGTVMGVRMGFTTGDLYRVAQQSGAELEFVSDSFHVKVAPSWQVAGALRGGRVVGWLSARRLPGGN